MTHRPIRTEPDGTRVYSNYTRYKPLSPEERKYGVNKPDHPDAVRFHARWFVPLTLLPDTQRSMPATREDAETLLHRATCTCEVCRRPQAPVHWRRERRRAAREARGGPTTA